MADAAGHEADPVAAPQAALFDRLAARPHDFGFYQAMRLLEAAHPAAPRMGRASRPSQDRWRLAQEPSVVFAPASLSAFERPADRPPRLLVRFFGLFGVDGPLPLHLTDHARDRARNWRDVTFQRFADIFHHRLLSLFWRAWADSRPAISFDRPHEDRFATYTGSLLGLGLESHRWRDAMPDLTKLHFAGLLAGQTRNAEGLAAILAAFFAMHVHLECFIGAWLQLEPGDRTLLGARHGGNAGLGTAAVLGGRIWSRTQKFRIVFGPLSLAQYMRLLPGGGSFHRLVAIVRNYAGDTLMWDVNLRLLADEVPQTRLGMAGQLGWTTWLGDRNSETPAADLFLDAGADTMAQAIDRVRGSNDTNNNSSHYATGTAP